MRSPTRARAWVWDMGQGHEPSTSMAHSPAQLCLGFGGPADILPRRWIAIEWLQPQIRSSSSSIDLSGNAGCLGEIPSTCNQPFSSTSLTYFSLPVGEQRRIDAGRGLEINLPTGLVRRTAPSDAGGNFVFPSDLSGFAAPYASATMSISVWIYLCRYSIFALIPSMPGFKVFLYQFSAQHLPGGEAPGGLALTVFRRTKPHRNASDKLR